MSSQSTPEVRPELPVHLEHASPVTLQGVSRAIAEVRAQVEAARLFPRNPHHAFQSLFQACNRLNFASQATYDVPRGGGTISGPSAHLAREAARCWGNMKYGFRVLEASDEIVHLQGWAWDLETGASVEVDDRFVPRVPRKSGRETVYVTPEGDDMRKLVSSRGSIAERNAIRKILPRDLIDDAEAVARGTVFNDKEGTRNMSLAERVRFMVASFDQLGVSVAMIEDRIGNGLDVVTDEQLGDLRDVYTQMAPKQPKDAEAPRIKGAPRSDFFDVNVVPRYQAETRQSAGAADLNARAKDSNAPEFRPQPAREPEVKREPEPKRDSAREVQVERSDRRGTVTPQERMRWITECDKQGLPADEWPRLRAEHLNGHEVETEGGVS